MAEFLLLLKIDQDSAVLHARSNSYGLSGTGFEQWVKDVFMSGRVVETAPLSMGVKQKAKLASGELTVDNDLPLVLRYMIVVAEDLHEVYSFTETCPLLGLPGGSVEIMPLLPFSS